MLEHITRVLYYLQIHLLYASCVAFAAWGLTAIPRSSATTKYWIWVATSCNFILPVGAVIDRVGGSQLYWASPLGVIGGFAFRALAWSGRSCPRRPLGIERGDDVHSALSPVVE